jgi:uridine kinase
MKDPKLVLITGESGSGKTTIAKALIETLNDKDVFLLEMEKYFIPYNKREIERKHYDDNSPAAFYIEKLVNDIKNAIDSKVFDYIIVEGTLTLYCDSIKDLSEYKIFVDCDEEVRFSRRMESNMEFGMGFDDLTNVYLDTAMQRHNQYVQMSKDNATLIVDGEKDLQLSVNKIIEFIK